MGESETVLWIKGQLGAGKSRSEVREMLVGTGYAADEADRLVGLGGTGLDDEGGVAQDSDSCEGENRKVEVSHESWVKVGGYAGACASVAFVVAFLTLVFFDETISNVMFVSFGAVLVIEGFIVANRNSNATIKETIGSAFIGSLILAFVYAIVIMFFGYHLESMHTYGYMSSHAISNAMSTWINFAVIGGSIASIILSLGVTLIMRFVLKRVHVDKINFMKPVVIISVLYILGIGLYCFSGEKIIHEPIDVYWCDGYNSELCDIEKLYEERFIKFTGYSFESYFTLTPNSNNRFVMNVYEIATAMIVYASIVSINMQNEYVRSEYDEMNLYDEYSAVFKGHEESLREFYAKNPEGPYDMLVLTIDRYNIYLNNLKRLIENSKINYNKDAMFKDKEHHLRYIQTKIAINNAIRKRYKPIEKYVMCKGYYALVKEDIMGDIYQYDSFERAPRAIRIKNVSLKDIPDDDKNKEIEIKISPEDTYVSIYDRSDAVKISVNGVPASNVKCEFKSLDVDEEGLCSGLIADDGILPKKIKLELLYREFVPMYLYEGE